MPLALNQSSAEVTLTVGNGSGMPGSSDNQVPINLENVGDQARGVIIDICDENNHLTCARCSSTERTLGFNCMASELDNGCARIILISLSDDIIEQGSGPLFTLHYEVSEGAPSNGCSDLIPENEKVTDEDGHTLPASLKGGHFHFVIWGDVYPQESPPSIPVCGDGIVGIYDIMEEINFVMGIVNPSECQAVRADVPNGKPPHCENPDGTISIYDAMVVIDKTLGRANCCSP